MSKFDLSKAVFGDAKRQYLAKIRYDNIVTKKVSSFYDIVGGRLEQGIQYRLVTDNSFNAITILNYIEEYYGRLDAGGIEEVYIVVYRMNYQSVRKIREIIGFGIRCVILLSEFFTENKRYERWAHELQKFGESNDNVTVFFYRSHAKILLVKTFDGAHIVFEGSGNLSATNSNVEQYIIEDNEEVYNFHKGWIEKIKNEQVGKNTGDH